MIEAIAPIPPKPPESSNRNRGRLGRAALSILVAASGTVLGLSVAHRMNAYRDQRTESKDKTESLADWRAAAFTAMLYDKQQFPKGVRMPVLNGEIRTTDTSPDGTKHESTYKNPILLATNDIDTQLDIHGKFLKDGWIGIRGNDKNGHAVIHAIHYETADETFVPYTSDPASIVFSNLGVYAESETDGLGSAVDGLVGFDTTGQTMLTNGNGSVIQPGDSLGMK